MTTLTPTEENLMKLFWELQTFYMRDVLEKHPEPKPHQNTVSTYLKLLAEKNFLTIEKEGRVFKYSVAIPFERYRKLMTEQFLEKYYDHSAPGLIKTLLQEKIITSDELSSFFEVKTLFVPKEEKIKSEKKKDDISLFVDKLKKDHQKSKKKNKKKKK